MNRFLFLFLLVCAGETIHAQYVYTIKADSVKITNSCDTAELIIENHTQTVPGFLFNKGRGRTEFRRIFQNLTDTTFLVGVDTMRLSNFWRQGGNRFGTTGIFGTMDNNPIDFYTNGIKRARWTSDGHFLINTDEDNWAHNFQVNGNALFTMGAVAGTDAFKIALIPDYDYGGYDGPKICFGTVRASIGVNKRDFGNLPSGSLLIGQTSPWHSTAIVDYQGNPTFVTDGGGWVTINGGYSGIQNGGSTGVGTNAGAPIFKIYGARGTGTGTPGDINFYTGKAQPSGTDIHTMDTARWVIKGETGFLTNVVDPNPLSTPSPTSALDISGPTGYSQFRLRKSYTPTSSADLNGKEGDFSWDVNNFYIKTPEGWKQAPLNVTNSARRSAIRNISGDATINDTDEYVFVNGASVAGGTLTVTLPPATGRDGQTFTIKRVDNSSNTVRVVSSLTQNIDASNVYPLVGQWSLVTVVANGNAWMIVSKN